ncbi:sulfatase [Actinomadura keratinilytica]|uniref:Sulfatase n=1 Tax=Actinomadura keratinilytica TaxID=547461 RepID=A0ABP7Z8A0_9ACTN
MSVFTPSPRGTAPPDGDPTTQDAPSRPRRALAALRRRRVWPRTLTVLAFLLVAFALLTPNRLDRLTPGAFARVPIEGVLGVVVVLVLRGRARRIAAGAGGAVLGMLLVVKIVDMGFYQVLVRPWDPVLDWAFVGAGLEFFTGEYGGVGGVAAPAGAVGLAVVVIVVVALAAVRLAGVAARHDSGAARAVAVLWAVWTVGTVFSVHLVPGVPVASSSTTRLAYKRVLAVRKGLHDKEVFARQAAVDAFGATPGDRLLTGLRGKDVLVAFIESYGRDAVEDPEFSAQVGAVLDAGGERLRKAGIGARSAWLTSSTVGGGSWLAHATLLSGLWIDNQQRYRNLVAGDRLTLNRAFHRAGWRTVGLMPAIIRAWPEGRFFGYDQVYDNRTLGYRGPRWAYATMPDQYVLSFFQRKEREARGTPVMAETALVSSHAPWAAVPRLVDWRQVGDGSVFNAQGGAGLDADWPPSDRIRAEYRKSIEYSLNTMVSYAETYGDDDLVLVFLGDHQPAPLITGEGASRDVPITIVARDPKVLDQISAWGWQDGLKPAPQSPVWRMSDFRDRFLTAFGSQPTAPSSPAPR